MAPPHQGVNGGGKTPGIGGDFVDGGRGKRAATENYQSANQRQGESDKKYSVIHPETSARPTIRIRVCCITAQSVSSPSLTTKTSALATVMIRPGRMT